EPLPRRALRSWPLRLLSAVSDRERDSSPAPPPLSRKTQNEREILDFDGDLGVYYRKSVSSPKALPEIQKTVSQIGAKVAKARAERGWSLAQLAERSGLSPAAVHKIEKSGMTPTIASLMKIASALGKSVGFFVEEADAARPVTIVRGD